MPSSASMQPVIFRHAVRSTSDPVLICPAPCPQQDRQCGVFSLTTAMRDDSRKASILSHFDGIEGLAE